MMELIVLLAFVAVALLAFAGDQAIRGDAEAAIVLAILGAAVGLATLCAVLGYALWLQALGGAA
jgi:hypothetical protein